jgi:hypothetical protein
MLYAPYDCTAFQGSGMNNNDAMVYPQSVAMQVCGYHQGMQSGECSLQSVRNYFSRGLLAAGTVYLCTMACLSSVDSVLCDQVPLGRKCG